MQVEARFRRRARPEEYAAALNAGLVVAISRLDELVGSGGVLISAPLDIGSGDSASVDLSPGLKERVRGAASYASRLPRAMIDRATSDDALVLEFDDNAVDVRRFALSTFPAIIKIFEPYRAVIVDDLEQDLDDHDSIVQEALRTGRDIDGRDTVWRFHAVNYFDNRLCLRAFGIDAHEVAARLAGLSETARLLEAGVLITIPTKNKEEYMALDYEVRKRLGMAVFQ